MCFKTIHVSLLFLLTTVRAEAFYSGCMPAEKIQPCICLNPLSFGGVRILCHEINQRQLSEINYHLAEHNIESLNITNSKLSEISKETFKNITPQRLVILKSTVINFNLFAGLQYMKDTMDQLIIKNLLVSNWILSSGDMFTRLENFEIIDCPKRIVNRNDHYIISYLPKSLKYLTFQNCELHSENNVSFVGFTDLEYLSLSRNRLTSLNRNHFPQPASKLYFYDLSNNPITSLPKNMFEEMPSLTNVWLNDTYLSRLDYYTFKPILGYLEELNLWNIPLICDCSVSWLHIIKYPWIKTDVLCQNPYSLKNHYLSSLTPKDMCINCQEILPVPTPPTLLYDQDKNGPSLANTTAYEFENFQYTDDVTRTGEDVTTTASSVYELLPVGDLGNKHCQRCLCIE